MPGTGEEKNPSAGYNFVLEIEGVKKAFSECSGLGANTNPVEYREGGVNKTVRKIPGLKKFSSITLKRGVTIDSALWDWRKSVLDGQIVRKDGSITLLDEVGQEALRWNFAQGWPTKWEGPSLNATGSEVAIETLEIAHEGLELAS
jgi:phage tail-like protein